MSGVTISVYLRQEEVAALRRYAAEHNDSLSFVLRMALRLLVGLPVGPSYVAELRERLAPDD